MAKKPLQEFEAESIEDKETVAELIATLQRGFQSGRLVFGQGSEELALGPAGMLHLSIKARRKNGRERITLQASWAEATGGRRRSAVRIRAGKAR